MKATIKHAAAVSKHGIMSTPNQPTQILLSVDVTHSQNSGQPARRPFCLRVMFEVVISKTILSRAPRVWMRNLFPVTPRYWIKRRSIILPLKVSVKAVVSGNKDITCVIYLNRTLQFCQASNFSFIIIFITTTKSVVNVIVPAVISRNIGMMCCVLILVILLILL